MKPNDKSEDSTSKQLDPTRQAAENILRSKINDIFEKNENAQSTESKDNNWQQYHSAWQDYYQKYYEGYYSKKYTDGSIYNDSNEKPLGNNITDEKGAVSEIREKLLSTVTESAEKVRKSRHYKPLLAGFIVILLFLFMQYNNLIIGRVVAYVSPGSINVQNIVVDPSADLTVDSAPRLIIPKINVDVPVVYDIGNDNDSLMRAMANGVAHFAIPGANSHPGQIGNTVISGHSSSDLLSSGDYKFIFVQLEKLTIGDTIYANYQSKRYTYIVNETKVVGPNDVSALVYPTTKPVMTLITCVPIGTADSRLLVIAEQVSPSPSNADAAPTTDSSSDSVNKMPGNQPTFLEWLFGKFGR